MRTIRFGIIGTGGIARRFALGLADVPGAQLGVVYNRGLAKAQAFAAQFGAQACDSVEALLASDIDAVYIGTPHTSHARYSIAAMQAGHAVLCEKPAAVSLAELDTVLAVARQTGRLFMEAMKPPFYPLFQQLDAHLARDPIGAIRYVRAGFANPSVPAGHALFDPDMAGGSLLDIGIYGAFLATRYLGPMREAQTLGRLSERGVDLFAAVNAQHQHGVSQIYCGMDVSGTGDAMLAGEAGHVLIHEKWWSPLRATISYTDGRRVEIDAPAVGSGLNYETEHFCALLRAGQTESPLLSHAQSRAMIGLLDAARDGLGLVYPFER